MLYALGASANWYPVHPSRCSMSPSGGLCTRRAFVHQPACGQLSCRLAYAHLFLAACMPAARCQSLRPNLPGWPGASLLLKSLRPRSGHHCAPTPEAHSWRTTVKRPAFLCPHCQFACSGLQAEHVPSACPLPHARLHRHGPRKFVQVAQKLAFQANVWSGTGLPGQRMGNSPLQEINELESMLRQLAGDQVPIRF